MRVFSLILALSGVLALSPAALGRAVPRTPVVPSAAQLSIMIKTTLIAFNDANLTGNYTVLRDLASPQFQEENTAAQLGEVFHRERKDKLDISAIVLLPPALNRPAWIDTRGFLHVEGFFPSQPKQLGFTLIFQPVEGKWRLSGLGVRTDVPPGATHTKPELSRGNKPARPAPSPPNFAERSWPPRPTPASSRFAQRSWPYWVGYNYAPLP
jgi:hypothetical protein